MPEETPPPSVVVVDDHLHLLGALVDGLEDEGLRVVGTAREGRSAVRVVEEHQPDAVLVDFFLAKSNGIEVLRRLEPVAPESKVVLYSGYWSKSHLWDALKAGAAGLADKDSSTQELAQLLLEVVESDEPKMDDHCRAEFGSAILEISERKVLALVAEGKELKEISAELRLGTETVRKRLRKTREKLGAKKTAEAVAIALREGLIA